MKDYIIYTDGSYRSSKKQMGIGIVWIKNGVKSYEYSKGIAGGTNNIAELYAIYLALKSIKTQIDSLKIFSDSEYSIGCISNPKWNPKKNLKLINSIKEQLKSTQKLVNSPIEFVHVFGHVGNEYNEIANKLAQDASNLLNI